MSAKKKHQDKVVYAGREQFGSGLVYHYYLVKEKDGAFELGRHFEFSHQLFSKAKYIGQMFACTLLEEEGNISYNKKELPTYFINEEKFKGRLSDVMEDADLLEHSLMEDAVKAYLKADSFAKNRLENYPCVKELLEVSSNLSRANRNQLKNFLMQKL